MQAVRLARYHTRRRYLVRFCGAYHGWWGDVQPGVGNPVAGARHLHARGDERARRCACCAAGATSPACWSIRCRRCIRTRARRPTPRWSTVRARRISTAPPTRHWLRQLREVCTQRGIVLIFDEVFVGFRLAPGGAQEYFGVRADLVTYGKTLAGGLPVGVLCGARATDAALPRRPAGRHLLRPRHLQFPSLRDGRDVRVPAPARQRGDPRALSATWMRAGTARGSSSTSGCAAEELQRAGGQPVLDLDGHATRSRRATTGCCNTTCARRAWR